MPRKLLQQPRSNSPNNHHEVKEHCYYNLLDAKNQGGFFMRTIRYYVINKTTRKAVFTDCSREKAVAFLNNFEHSKNFTVVYKWLSV